MYLFTNNMNQFVIYVWEIHIEICQKMQNTRDSGSSVLMFFLRAVSKDTLLDLTTERHYLIIWEISFAKIVLICCGIKPA